MSDTTPNWAPLEANLAPELCAEFMWMFRKDGVAYYKHIQTRRYLQLTAEGRCTAQPFEDHWKFVSGRAGGQQHEFSCRSNGYSQAAGTGEARIAEARQRPEVTQSAG